LSELLILIAGYAASLFMAWCIGANDASNPTETAVGAGALSVKQALILFSIFAAVGALAQGWMVMKTLGAGIVPRIDLYGALTAVLAAGMWITIASWRGLPISTTHSITGAVLGVGLAYVALGKMSVSSLNWGAVIKIVASWITSPIASILLAAAIYLGLRRLAFSERAESVLRIGLISALAFSAYSFGANDVANATGVYLTVTRDLLGMPDVNTQIFLAVLGSIGIALGGFTLGKRVIITTAYKITRLEVVSGLAAELSNALVVWLFTTVPYMLFGFGIPISTTYASIASVIGVGLARYGVRGVNWRTVALIITSWITTLPITVSLAFTLRILVHVLASA